MSAEKDSQTSQSRSSTAAQDNIQSKKIHNSMNNHKCFYVKNDLKESGAKLSVERSQYELIINIHFSYVIAN